MKDKIRFNVLLSKKIHDLKQEIKIKKLQIKLLKKELYKL